MMIKTVSMRWLLKQGACEEARKEFMKQKNHDLITTLKRLNRNGNDDWSYWLLERVLPTKLREEWVSLWNNRTNNTTKDFLKFDLKIIRKLEKIRKEKEGAIA